MRIGIVDLDTSHPGSWIPIERELGLEIVGLWDGGEIHPAGYAEQFAKEHNISRVFLSIDEMVGEVDCAVIHACNWDTHIDKAGPFVEAGKSVLIDKPLAGNTRDLKQLVEWTKSASGGRITGGSSLRFCVETRDWLAQPVDERGTPDTVLCGCGVDEFNYGIHAYSMLSGIMGPGIQSVKHLGKGVQHRIQVNWADGRMGFLVMGTAETWLPFYTSITTEKTSVQYQADSAKLYRALLEAVVPYLSGNTNEPPLPMDVLIESELCAIAARRSWLEGNREVSIAELSESGDGYNGRAFAIKYRKLRYS